ncbi:hypothetical protein EGT67_07190 [Prescottella agglutinans]|uniref:Uncharacterized protein n=2 Tax=Prescottella agglutinans TaxID=1644129 RepID=A0A438BG48_9NOCA|nr:hypothetical protein EGT67_07190 [Prescottella agglutinans]
MLARLAVMSTLITLACMSALAAFVYHYLPRDRPRKRFRLEQFRPAAPLAGILDADEDRGGGADTPTNPASVDRSSIDALD